MLRWVLVGFALVLVGCASPQRLSASIYTHEQLAGELDASGEFVAAAVERRDAQRERERLGGSNRSLVMNREYW